MSNRHKCLHISLTQEEWEAICRAADVWALPVNPFAKSAILREVRKIEGSESETDAEGA
jgi:hypothetical protein